MVIHLNSALNSNWGNTTQGPSSPRRWEPHHPLARCYIYLFGFRLQRAATALLGSSLSQKYICMVADWVWLLLGFGFGASGQRWVQSIQWAKCFLSCFTWCKEGSIYMGWVQGLDPAAPKGDHGIRRQLNTGSQQPPWRRKKLSCGPSRHRFKYGSAHFPRSGI